MSKYYVFVEGLYGDPEDPNRWVNRGEHYIEMNCPGCHASILPYEAGVIFRRMGQEERVNNLDFLLKRIENQHIVVVAYSNGGDITERLIKRKTRVIDEVHLIAPACESDFRKNGFNEAMDIGLVKRFFIHWSKNDTVLRKAKWSSYLLSAFGLGYGYLGLVGPKYVSAKHKDKVIDVEHKLMHHNYWDENNFGEMMKKITLK